MPDARCIPRSRVQNAQKLHTSIQGSGGFSDIPRAMVYGLLRALPGDRACLPPSLPRSLLLKNLTPASGRRDHTASPSASGAVVCSTLRVHRIPSRVRDDREPPPLVGRDGGNYKTDLLIRKTRIFLQGRLDMPHDMGHAVICPSGQARGPTRPARPPLPVTLNAGASACRPADVGARRPVRTGLREFHRW